MTPISPAPAAPAAACPQTILLDTARYFELKGCIDEAVQLYQRGKQAGRALELALTQNRPDAVGVLASQLGPDSDPKLLIECAEALRGGGSFEEAMWLYLHAKRCGGCGGGRGQRSPRGTRSGL